MKIIKKLSCSLIFSLMIMMQHTLLQSAHITIEHALAILNYNLTNNTALALAKTGGYSSETSILNVLINSLPAERQEPWRCAILSNFIKINNLDECSRYDLFLHLSHKNKIKFSTFFFDRCLDTNKLHELDFSDNHCFSNTFDAFHLFLNPLPVETRSLYACKILDHGLKENTIHNFSLSPLLKSFKDQPRKQFEYVAAILNLYFARGKIHEIKSLDSLLKFLPQEKCHEVVIKFLDCCLGNGTIHLSDLYTLFNNLKETQKAYYATRILENCLSNNIIHELNEELLECLLDHLPPKEIIDYIARIIYHYLDIGEIHKLKFTNFIDFFRDEEDGNPAFHALIRVLDDYLAANKIYELNDQFDDILILLKEDNGIYLSRILDQYIECNKAHLLKFDDYSNDTLEDLSDFLSTNLSGQAEVYVTRILDNCLHNNTLSSFNNLELFLNLLSSENRELYITKISNHCLTNGTSDTNAFSKPSYKQLLKILSVETRELHIMKTIDQFLATNALHTCDNLNVIIKENLSQENKGIYYRRILEYYNDKKTLFKYPTIALLTQDAFSLPFYTFMTTPEAFVKEISHVDAQYQTPLRMFYIHTMIEKSNLPLAPSTFTPEFLEPFSLNDIMSYITYTQEKAILPDEGKSVKKLRSLIESFLMSHLDSLDYSIPMEHFADLFLPFRTRDINGSITFAEDTPPEIVALYNQYSRKIYYDEKTQSFMTTRFKELPDITPYLPPFFNLPTHQLPLKRSYSEQKQENAGQPTFKALCQDQKSATEGPILHNPFYS